LTEDPFDKVFKVVEEFVKVCEERGLPWTLTREDHMVPVALPDGSRRYVSLGPKLFSFSRELTEDEVKEARARALAEYEERKK